MQAKVVRIFGAVATAFVLARADSMEVYKEPPRGADGKYAYQGTVEVEGVPASELYSRARAWAANAYRSMNDVQQLDDKDAGRLILKGNFRAGRGGLVLVWHTLTIETKDDRYRYLLTDFETSVPSVGSVERQPLERSHDRPGKTFLAEVDVLASGLIDSLMSAMSAPAEEW